MPSSRTNLLRQNIAPHLLRPDAPPEQDAEAQLKHKRSLSSNDDEAPNDQFSSDEIDDSDKEKARVETRGKSSRLVSIPSINITDSQT